MWNLLYNGLLIITAPVILVILWAKPRCRRGLSQRFGFTGPRVTQDGRPLVWLHAVSLGEVVAITPLVKELKRRHPTHRFIVSTTTETGRDAVEQRLAGIAEHLYAPIDFPWAVSRTVARLRPVLYVFIETELWPNLLRHLSGVGVPTIMINGRLSSASFARLQWRPVKSFYRSVLRSMRLCLMQSDRDAERIISLGADPGSVRRTGNIKFDQPLPTEAERRVTRATLGIEEDALLVIGGSTHPIEEEQLVEAFVAVLSRHPSARLMLAPRHIERAEAVEAMVRGRGLAVSRRSAMAAGFANSEAKPHVIILDSRGELALIYQEATVAFVGGTLVPVGGHNLLEPASWAKPVLFGPYTDHCVEIADLLTQAGGGRRVASVDELTDGLLHLLEQRDERVRMGQAAQSVVRQNQGALQATIEAIDGQLDSVETIRSSARSHHSFPLMAGH